MVTMLLSVMARGEAFLLLVAHALSGQTEQVRLTTERKGGLTDGLQHRKPDASVCYPRLPGAEPPEIGLKMPAMSFT